MPPPRYTLNPYIRWITESGRAVLDLPLYGLRIEATPALRDLCTAAADVSGLDETRCNPEVLAYLADHFILLDQADEKILRYGLVRPAENPAGETIGIAGLLRLGPDQIVVFNAPIEYERELPVSIALGGRQVRAHLAGLLNRGGPDDLIIDFDLGQQLRAREVALRDLGEVVFVSELEAMSAIGYRTRKLVEAISARQCVPVVLGGDHSIAYYAISAIRRKNPGFSIVHFDAHHDFYLPSGGAGTAALNHSNFFHQIVRMQEVNTIVQIGLRDLYRVPAGATPSERRDRVRRVSCREACVVEPAQLFASLDREVPIYISFDVDVLEAVTMNGTATPMLGGMPYWRTFDLMHYLFNTYRVLGVDFSEIGPGGSQSGSPADIAARMIMLLVFAKAGSEPAQSHVFSPGDRLSD